MERALKELIASDIKRVSAHPLTLKERLSLPPQLKYLILWRKAAFYYKKGGFLRKWYGLLLDRAQEKTQITLPRETEAGPGLYIGHYGRLIVSPDAKIGKNVNLSTGITIGAANRGSKKGAPVIGDEVWIGTNAVIVGHVTIGNDVMIAPGAFVNFDVPAHSVVVGNPGVIHAKENATEGYINGKV